MFNADLLNCENNSYSYLADSVRNSLVKKKKIDRELRDLCCPEISCTELTDSVTKIQLQSRTRSSDLLCSSLTSYHSTIQSQILKRSLN